MSIGYVAGLEKARKVQPVKEEVKVVKKTTKKAKVEEFD